MKSLKIKKVEEEAVIATAAAADRFIWMLQDEIDHLDLTSNLPRKIHSL